MDKSTIIEFLSKNSINYNNIDFFERAFTHSSFLNEHSEIKINSYQRLEFLGDAVLSLLASEHLFSLFPKSPEGMLTDVRAALVKTETLAHIARTLNIGQYIYLSKGEKKNKGDDSDNILADVLEALLAAIYLDQGFAAAKRFFLKNISGHIQTILKEKTYIDPKTALQEITQSKYKQVPSYVVLNMNSNNQFRIGVRIQNKIIAHGVGKNKKKAEERAAKKAIGIISNM